MMDHTIITVVEKIHTFAKFIETLVRKCKTLTIFLQNLRISAKIGTTNASVFTNSNKFGILRRCEEILNIQFLYNASIAL